MNLGPLHHAPRKCAVQWRQSESSIAKDFNQLTARAEEQHWTELWINAAAENELISVARHHRLHDDTEKIFDLAARPQCFLDLSICRTNGGFSGQIELHAADICFVRNG